jgi:hypothetical protein
MSRHCGCFVRSDAQILHSNLLKFYIFSLKKQEMSVVQSKISYF